MSSQVIIFATAIIYFLLMIVIGFWAQRRTSSAKEFLVAGQSLGFFVMAIAAFSSIQSGWGFVGNTGTAYGWGVQGLLAGPILVPLGFALSWFLLGARLRRAAQHHEIYSIPDFIKVRYRDRSSHIAMSVAIFLGTVGYMTAQIAAMGVVMSLLFGVSIAWGAWIGAAIVAAYTIAGGMLAAVWTDLIQGLLMVVISIAVFIAALSITGGWGGMLNSVSGGDSSLVSISEGVQPFVWILGSAIMITFGAAGQPQLVHKFLMLRDEQELRWGALVAGVAYATTTLFSLGIGLAVRAGVADGSISAFENVDNVAAYFLNNLVNPVLGGLALTAILAAIMSSASSFITIGASSMMRDFTGGLGISVRRELLWGRICSGIIVLLALLFGIYLDQIIFLLGSFGWAAFAGAIVGPIALGLYWKRATAIATTVSIAAGLLFNFITTILTARGIISLPDYIFIGGVAVAGSILLFIVISYFTQSTNEEKNFDALYQADEQTQREQASA